jgi:hypothetical protein
MHSGKEWNTQHQGSKGRKDKQADCSPLSRLGQSNHAAEKQSQPGYAGEKSYRIPDAEYPESKAPVFEKSYQKQDCENSTDTSTIHLALRVINLVRYEPLPV